MASIDPFLERFDHFVADFYGQIPKHTSSIKLKQEHTRRVLNEARDISASLNLSAHRQRQVELAAVFHDIGRFPQLKLFGTFKDSESANHGLLGYKVLRQEKILDDLSTVDRQLVLQAVIMHNKPQIPAGLPEQLDQVLRIVRDSDKLDIIHIFISHWSNNSGKNRVVTHGLDDDPECLTESILKQALAGKIVNYNEISWMNDLRLFLCCWVYDINYPFTKKEFLRRNYLGSLMASLPDIKNIHMLKKRLKIVLSKN